MAGATNPNLYRGIHVGLTQSIAVASALTHELNDETFATEAPRRTEAVRVTGHASDGLGIASTRNAKLTRSEPGMSLKTATTPITWAMFWSSLLQNNGYASGEHRADLSLRKHTADLFLHMERGTNVSGSTKYWKGYGGVVSKIAVEMPEETAEGADTSMTADVLFADSTEASSATSGSPTTDPSGCSATSDWAFSLDETAIDIRSASFEFSNGAMRDRGSSATPQRVKVGNYEGNGKVAATLDASAGTPYTLLKAHADAGTFGRLDFVLTDLDLGIIFTKVMFGQPTTGSGAGSVQVEEFPFTIFAESATSVYVYSTTTDMEWD